MVIGARWRPAVALLFLAAGAYHLIALARPELAEPSPPWRHALFAFINALIAAGLVLRPPGFAWALALLTAQQLVSHGTYAREVWARERRVDGASIVVLLGLPALVAAVVRDDRRRGRS